MNAKADFKLKMGPQVLTELHQKRLFRIQIRPMDATLADQHRGCCLSLSR